MRIYSLLFVAVFLLTPILPNRAMAAVAGDACTTANTIQRDNGETLICDGSKWNAAVVYSSNAGRILFQVDNDAGSCTTDKLGRLKFNAASTPPWQYCNGSAWVPFDSASATASPGYLVQTTTKWNGNLGGLAGADAKCLTELQTTYNWNGKANAGTLSSSRVHALLCDSTTCNNLTPNTLYLMAKANSATGCGWGFMTDANGLGPNSQTYWDETCYNSSSDQWMNRGTTSASAWAATPKGTGSCSNWGATSGNGALGNAGNNDATRWDSESGSCNTANLLVCMVNP